MAADVLAQADGIVTALTASFAVNPPVIATIGRVFRDEFDVKDFEDLRVDVFPFPYRDAGDITRIEFEEESTVYIVIAKQWREPDRPPQSWIDELVNLVHDRVFLIIKGMPLDSEGHRRIGLRVTTLCDYQMLRELKVFWSEVEVTYRHIETY